MSYTWNITECESRTFLRKHAVILVYLHEKKYFEVDEVWWKWRQIFKMHLWKTFPSSSLCKFYQKILQELRPEN